MGETESIKRRDQWSGRTAFILAAIGSAVGLGNLWAFPYKLYEYGGAAFLVPYLIALVVLGVPLLIMEYVIGHWAQQSAPGAFGRILGRYRFVGWWLTILAFIIVTYYVVILAYCNVYLFESLAALFSGEALPWSGDAAEKHFDQVHQAGSGYGLGLPAVPVLLGTAVGWALIYFCLFRGVGWVSKVVLFTVPLPWLMLVILAVRGLTLEGAETGLHFYLEPDWSKLLEADTWRFAFGQVFFSLSLGFAVMLSYASFLHRKSDLNNNAAIIGLGDLSTSFLAGIVVFSTLGNFALQNDMKVDAVVEDSVGLAFVAFPHALSQLPAGAAAFTLVFFVALLTLGIDSAFSIVEAVQAAVNDNKTARWRARWTLPVVCAVGFLISVLFTCKGGGLNWLGWTDRLINGPFGIPTVALAECLVVGWAWGGALSAGGPRSCQRAERLAHRAALDGHRALDRPGPAAGPDRLDPQRVRDEATALRPRHHDRRGGLAERRPSLVDRGRRSPALRRPAAGADGRTARSGRSRPGRGRTPPRPELADRGPALRRCRGRRGLRPVPRTAAGARGGDARDARFRGPAARHRRLRDDRADRPAHRRRPALVLLAGPARGRPG